MAKNGVIMYYDLLEQLKDFSDAQFGKLTRALLQYDKDGYITEFNDMQLKLAFQMLKPTIDRNKEDYLYKCEKNRENVLKRWGKHHTNEYDGIRTNTIDTDNDIDNDIDNDNKEKEIEEKEKNISFKQIQDLYNEICISFPKVKTLSEARKRAIRARLKTYSLEDFKNVFVLSENSDFLKGKNNRNWTANFDWLIKDANFAKVLDGNYKNNDVGKKNIRERKYSDVDYNSMIQSIDEITL